MLQNVAVAVARYQKNNCKTTRFLLYLSNHNDRHGRLEAYSKNWLNLF